MLGKWLVKQTKIVCFAVITLALLLGAGVGIAHAVLTSEQIVTLSPSSPSQAVGSSFTISAMYDVSDGDNTLTGLGLRIHYDSSKLTWTGFSNVLATDKMGEDSTPQDDTSNDDNDANTDKYLQIAWTNLGGSWPNANLPLKLYDIGFTANAQAPAGSTNVNLSFSSNAAGYSGVGNGSIVTVTIPPGSITGTVAYSGSGTGPIMIGAFTNQGMTGDPAYGTTIASPGSFTFSSVAPGIYYVGAYRDITGNGLTAEDPKGAAASAVTVTSGNPAAAGTITLVNPPTKLVFTNTALNQAVGVKGTMTVQLQDMDNNAVEALDDITVNLTSTSSAFYDDPTGNTEITSVTITQGNNFASFKYYDDVVGTPTVTGTDSLGNYTPATQQQTITVGPLASLTVSPDTQTVTADDTQQFQVSGLDPFGNPVDPGVVNWTVNGGIGTISTGGLFTAVKVGQGSVTATKGGVSDTSGTITVNVGVLAALTVSPDTAALTADQTQQFTVAGVDADNNPTTVLGTITWSVNGSIGTISTGGLFNATTPGTGSVTATSSLNNVTDTSGAVTVTPGAAASILLTSNRDKVASEGKSDANLSATYKDADNNTVTNLAATSTTFTVTGAGIANAGWTTTAADTAGGVAPTVFTTQGQVEPDPPGSTTVSVTATGGGLTSNALALTIVNFSATPVSSFLTTGGSTVINAVGATGYVWSKVSGNGNLSATSGAQVTFTAPASITEGTAGHVTTIRVVDAADSQVSYDFIITTYNPVRVTAPAAAVGITHDGNVTTYQMQATGGDGTYSYQVNGTAGVITVSPSGLVTGQAIGTRTVYVWDSHGSAGAANGFAAESPAIEVVDGIVVSPVSTNLAPAGTQQFTAAGGSGQQTFSINNSASGSIATAGLFTAANVTKPQSATVTATDVKYTNIKGIGTVNVYPTLTVTNKPSAPLIIDAGGSSTTFTAAGGDDNLTWSVTGPLAVAGATGAEFSFKAPNQKDANGNWQTFAGKYTITVTDNNGFTDSFDVYVPIKVLVVKSAADKTPQKPILTTGNTYTIFAAGVGTNLDISYVETPLDAARTPVLNADKPISVNQATFPVTAVNPGSAVITVQDNADTETKYEGSLRVDVFGVATVSGTVSNIPSNLIDDPTTDIKVELLNPITQQSLTTPKSTMVGADGTFSFANIPWQYYCIKVSVKDADNPQLYIPVYLSEDLLVHQVTVTQDFSLPTLELAAFTLTVNLTSGYTAPDPVSYMIYDSNNVVVRQGTNVVPVGTSFSEPMKTGEYRLLVCAAGYQPAEYTDPIDTTNKLINFNQDTTVEVAMTKLPPITFVSHANNDDGFVLRVATQNLTGAFSMGVNAQGDVAHDGTGTGTLADPYIYTWTTAGPATTTNTNTPNTGDTTYTVTFSFYDGGGWLGKTYTVTYVDYADTASMNNDTSDENQENFKVEFGNDTVVYKIQNGREFYPLAGTSFSVTLKEANGADRDVDIYIPPIPLEYLFIDDFDAAGAGADNLQYGGVKPAGNDYYDVPGVYTKVTPGMVLRVTVIYYTLEGAVGNGAYFTFEVAHDPLGTTPVGTSVRYNPIQHPDGSGRDANAPKIRLPLLLDTQSSVFSEYSRISDASGEIVVKTEERGDGRLNFAVERLPFLLQDDGLMLIDIHHLTGVGAGIAGSSGSGGGSKSGCFIATAAYGSLLERHVEILRQFRDVVLLPSKAGSAFVEAYYKYSPPMADYIAEHENLRAVTRVALLPLVGMSYLVLNVGMAWTMMAFGGLLLLFSVPVGFRRRKKKK